MQRLRVVFSRGEEIKFISHLDLMRCWERVLLRADIPVAYSEGFNPRPRMALAAPLAVGVTSECELMDIYLANALFPDTFRKQVMLQLPVGLMLGTVTDVPLGQPSLQALMRGIEYRVTIKSDFSRGEIEQIIEKLLQAKHLPWQQTRGNVLVKYDLRPLLGNIWVIDREESCCILGMHLCVTPRGTGRPEQVTRAMGITEFPLQIHRVRLILNDIEAGKEEVPEEGVIE